MTHFSSSPEAISERCSPIRRLIPQALTDVEKTVIVFMFFAVVVLISRPTTTDAKDVQGLPGFGFVPVMVVCIWFRDGMPRERVPPQEVGGICQP